MITFDPVVLTLIVGAGTLVPLVTGFISKQSAPKGIKVAVNLLLSAVSAIIISIQQNNGILTQETLLQGYGVFITGIAAYYGALKPSGVSEKVSGVTGDRGVG